MTDPVAAAYNEWSASYDVDHNRTRDLDAEVLRAANVPIAGADVLEVGCGTGKNTVYLAQHARRVTALDFSPGMLAKARARVAASHVTFVQHDVRESWPVPSASVDVVVTNLVLEHVADVAPVFAEAHRVLRDGGTCYVAELHPFRQWQGGRAHFTASNGDVVHVPVYMHRVSEFVNAAVGPGFRITRLGEHAEDGADASKPPRLLSLQCVKTC